MKNKPLNFKKYLIYKYHIEKKSQAKIAKEIGISQASVSLYMLKFKIPKRTHSEAILGDLNPFKGLSGRRNPNYKGGKPNCLECGKSITYYSKKCDKCKYINSEDSPNWQGGKSFEEYPKDFNNELKEKIRKRDKYKCQLCGITKNEHLIIRNRTLDVHHIDYNKKNCLKNNLITICGKCNLKVNYNREFWKLYFNLLIIENFF